jgi:hypothetical protein
MSSLFPWRSISAVASVALLVGACSDTLSADAFSDTSNGSPENSDGGSAFSPNGEPPPTEKSGFFRGNPLCNVTASDCLPDDEQPSHCKSASADAGADGSLDGPARGCRIVNRPDKPVGPDCEDASYAGTDGAKCASGADCAPGFDCVGSNTGTGTFCRRYCCLGSCPDPSSNGGASFCDVQQLRDIPKVAPVCMPLKPCTLLSTDECGPEETCAIVGDAGETGCVSRGRQKSGDPCDETHCDVNLTCLGQPGNRKCQTLCRVGGAQTCTYGQVCKTTSAFKDATFGICQAP